MTAISANYKVNCRSDVVSGIIIGCSNFELNTTSICAVRGSSKVFRRFLKFSVRNQTFPKYCLKTVLCFVLHLSTTTDLHGVRGPAKNVSRFFCNFLTYTISIFSRRGHVQNIGIKRVQNIFHQILVFRTHLQTKAQIPLLRSAPDLLQQLDVRQVCNKSKQVEPSLHSKQRTQSTQRK